MREADRTTAAVNLAVVGVVRPGGTEREVGRSGHGVRSRRRQDR